MKKVAFVFVSILMFILFCKETPVSAEVSRTLDVDPQGDTYQNKSNELRWFAHSDLYPTGIFLKKGEKITVNSDSIDNVSIWVGQLGKYEYLNGGKEVAREQIKLTDHTQIIQATSGDGVVYVSNKSNSDNAKVTISGGTEIPFFIKGQTTNEEIHEQIEKCKDAPFIQLLGDRTIVNFQYNVVSERLLGRSVQELVDYLDTVVEESDYVSGLNPRIIGNAGREFNNRVLFETPDEGGGYASATNGHLIFQKNTGAALDLAGANFENQQWGIWHEVGHTYQNLWYKWSGLTEVTVNINSAALQEKFGFKDDRYGEGTELSLKISEYLERTDPDKLHNNNLGEFGILALFRQLAVGFGADFYPRLNQSYRQLAWTNYPFPNSDDEKVQLFIRQTSITSGRDLTTYFEKWGFSLTEETKEWIKSKNLQPLDKPIWENLLHDNKIAYEDGLIFSAPSLELSEEKDWTLGEREDVSRFIKNKFSNPIASDVTISGFTKVPYTTLESKSNIKVNLKNTFGVESQVSIPLDVKPGNALSIFGYKGSQERIILTLNGNKKNNIHAINNLAYDKEIDAGNGEYARVELYSSKGDMKKLFVINYGERPDEFVKNIDNLEFDEGDYLRVKMSNAKRMMAYADSKVSLDQNNASSEEWFKLKESHFEPLGTNGQNPFLTLKDIKKNIGDNVSPNDFIEDIQDIFGNDSVSVEFGDIKPDLTYPHEQTISIIAKNKLGYKTEMKSQLTVNRNNEVSIFGYNSDQERIFIKTKEENNQLLATNSSSYSSQIESGTGQYASVKIFDKNLKQQHEATINCEDNPSVLTNELNKISINEGDFMLIELTVPGRISSIEDNNLTLKQSDSLKAEWFVVKNKKLRSMGRYTPTPKAEIQKSTAVIGEKIESSSFIKSLYSMYNDSDIDISFINSPDTTHIGSRKAKIKLTSPSNYSSEYEVDYDTKRGNDITLFGYLGTQPRVFLRLNTDKKELFAIKNSQHNTPMESGNGKYFTITQYDRELKKKNSFEVNKDETPDKFVNSISGTSYSDGDLIKIVCSDISRMDFYLNNNELLNRDDATKEEWFTIENEQLILIKKPEAPIDPVFDQATLLDTSRIIKGKTSADAEVRLTDKDGTSTANVTIADREGHFQFDLEKPYEAGKKIYVVASNKVGTSKIVEGTIALGDQKPKVDSLIEGDKSINGSGKAGNTITIKNLDSIIGKTIIADNGKFSLKLDSPLQKNQELKIYATSKPSDPLNDEFMTIATVCESIGSFTPNDYYVGQRNIEGIYTGTVKTIRLSLGGKYISRGGDFSEGKFTYYSGEGRIKADQTIKLEAFDRNNKLLDTKQFQALNSSVGNFSTATYKLGTSEISGMYTGQISKGKLTVNGKVVSWGGTFDDSQFNYYLKAGTIIEGDKVSIQAYDKYDSPLSKQHPVSLEKTKGQLLTAVKNKDAIEIKGTYDGEVNSAQLRVNGKIISQGGTFVDGKYSYYVGKTNWNENEKVTLQGLDNMGLPVEGKEINVKF